MRTLFRETESRNNRIHMPGGRGGLQLARIAMGRRFVRLPFSVHKISDIGVAQMDHALALEAELPTFDDLESILVQNDCFVTRKSNDSITRGNRQTDSVNFQIVLEGTSVKLWAERRVGNPAMFVLVVPLQESKWHPYSASDKIARRIVELLVAHGARFESVLI